MTIRGVLTVLLCAASCGPGPVEMQPADAPPTRPETPRPYTVAELPRRGLAGDERLVVDVVASKWNARLTLYDAASRQHVRYPMPTPDRLWFWPEPDTRGAYVELRTNVGGRPPLFTFASADFRGGARFVRHGEDPVTELAASGDGSALVVHVGGRLESLDARRGTVRAQRALGTFAVSLVALEDGVVFRAGDRIHLASFEDLVDRCVLPVPPAAVGLHATVHDAGAGRAVVRFGGIANRSTGELTMLADFRSCRVERTAFGAFLAVEGGALFTQIEREEPQDDVELPTDGDHFLLRTDLSMLSSRALPLPSAVRPDVTVARGGRTAFMTSRFTNERVTIVDLETGGMRALELDPARDRSVRAGAVAYSQRLALSRDGESLFVLADENRSVSGASGKIVPGLVRIELTSGRVTYQRLGDHDETSGVELNVTSDGTVVVVRQFALEVYEERTLARLATVSSVGVASTP